MRTFFGTIGIVVLLASVGAPLIAQDARSGGLDSSSIVMLKPNRFVRIQLPDLGRVQGTVGFLTATEMVLRTEAETRTVSLGAVDTLWVRGRNTKAGAIIGAIVGLGGGIFLGLLAEGLCEYDCGGNVAVPVALVGMGAGALSGAVVGSAIPRWRRAYPR